MSKELIIFASKTGQFVAPINPINVVTRDSSRKDSILKDSNSSFGKNVATSVRSIRIISRRHPRIEFLKLEEEGKQGNRSMDIVRYTKRRVWREREWWKRVTMDLFNYPEGRHSTSQTSLLLAANDEPSERR